METDNWVQVASAEDLDDEEGIKVVVANKPIALFFVNGTYFAIDDGCTHENASLSKGFVDGDTVECPLHQGVFCLKTGRALHAPAEIPVSTYPVKVDGTKIYIRADTV